MIISEQLKSMGMELKLTGPEEEDPSLYTVIGLLGAVTLLPWTFALTQDDRTAQYAWPLLEQFLAIFLAVSWFSAFGLWFTEDGTILMYFWHFLVVYFFVHALLWAVRFHAGTLHSLSAIGAHFVSFAAIHAGDKMQRTYFADSAA